MPITISVVGFYYEIDIDSTGIVTVLDAMNAAQNVRSDKIGKRGLPNGGVLNFVDNNNTGFMNEISVTYDPASNPETRQQRNGTMPANPERQKGRYIFNDAVVINGQFNPNVEIRGGGDVQGILSWQYYVFDSSGMPKNNDNEIRPLKDSKPLTDGDMIVWRLIGIFGLNERIKSALENRPELFVGRTLSLKGVMSEINSVSE